MASLIASTLLDTLLLGGGFLASPPSLETEFRADSLHETRLKQLWEELEEQRRYDAVLPSEFLRIQLERG